MKIKLKICTELISILFLILKFSIKSKFKL